MVPNTTPSANRLTGPAPVAGAAPALEGGAVFAPDSAHPEAIPDGWPELDLGPAWAMNLTPALPARTLGAAPFKEGPPRSEALAGGFGKALKNGLLAAGLLLAPLGVAEAGVPMAQTVAANVVVMQGTQQALAHGAHGPKAEAMALSPGQSLLVPPGTQVAPDAFRGDADHHFEVTTTRAGLEVRRLATDADAPLPVGVKALLGVLAVTGVAMVGMLGLTIYDLECDNKGTEKLDAMKARLAQLLKNGPHPKES
jgi:hypothetical protein